MIVLAFLYIFIIFLFKTNSVVMVWMMTWMVMVWMMTWMVMVWMMIWMVGLNDVSIRYWNINNTMSLQFKTISSLSKYIFPLLNYRVSILFQCIVSLNWFVNYTWCVSLGVMLLILPPFLWLFQMIHIVTLHLWSLWQFIVISSQWLISSVWVSNLVSVRGWLPMSMDSFPSLTV